MPGAYRAVCGSCGSDQVTVEMECAWDEGLQRWAVLGDPFEEAAWCERCREAVEVRKLAAPGAPPGEDETALMGTVP